MKFGLIGYPISHSLSPQLWAEAFPGAEHTYDLIQEQDFSKAFEKFRAEYDAVNVTMPFKELAYFASTPANEDVRAIKAVNILKKRDGGVVGYNSDFLAVKSLISDAVQNPAAAKVMIIGAGGAARAAAIAACSLGCRVAMANRSHGNCLSFVRHTTYNRQPLDIKVFEIQDAAPAVNDSDILIYAIPKPLIQIGEWKLGGKTVMEANYLDACLGEKTASQGGIYISGKEWLRCQAEFGYKLFF